MTAWEDERPEAGTSFWAAGVIAAVAAFQEESELVPWAARVAAGRLPTAFRPAGGLGGAGGPGIDAVAGAWAHNASLLLAVHALARALPRGWAQLRKAELAALALAKSFAAELASAGVARGGVDAVEALGRNIGPRLHFAFALHALGVESFEGGRVCC